MVEDAESGDDVMGAMPEGNVATAGAEEEAAAEEVVSKANLATDATVELGGAAGADPGVEAVPEDVVTIPVVVVAIPGAVAKAASAVDAESGDEAMGSMHVGLVATEIGAEKGAAAEEVASEASLATDATVGVGEAAGTDAAAEEVASKANREDVAAGAAARSAFACGSRWRSTRGTAEP